MKTIDVFGLKLDIDDNGNSAIRRVKVDVGKTGDHGADPLGDGRFRMIPSGDVVDYAERCMRLGKA